MRLIAGRAESSRSASYCIKLQNLHLTLGKPGSFSSPLSIGNKVRKLYGELGSCYEHIQKDK